MVERTFPQGLHSPVSDDGAQVCLGAVGCNTDVGVTRVHSSVSADETPTACIYDAPDQRSIRTAAASNGLPVEHITRVSVLDPYFYR